MVLVTGLVTAGPGIGVGAGVDVAAGVGVVVTTGVGIGVDVSTGDESNPTAAVAARSLAFRAREACLT